MSTSKERLVTCKQLREVRSRRQATSAHPVEYVDRLVDFRVEDFQHLEAGSLFDRMVKEEFGSFKDAENGNEAATHIRADEKTNGYTGTNVEAIQEVTAEESMASSNGKTWHKHDPDTRSLNQRSRFMKKRFGTPEVLLESSSQQLSSARNDAKKQSSDQADAVLAEKTGAIQDDQKVCPPLTWGKSYSAISCHTSSFLSSHPFGIFLILLTSILLCYYCRYRRRRHITEKMGGYAAIVAYEEILDNGLFDDDESSFSNQSYNGDDDDDDEEILGAAVANNWSNNGGISTNKAKKTIELVGLNEEDSDDFLTLKEING